ncbi:hypothetical protein TRVL_08435 [Trypanosoma vivax]|uniref:Uncharacterized protein n=1 Tax=Trypanosoma vivax (strain Y486) TaxID=1055687 RepID=G0U3D3_TRYVY|nr:hypothetical protein TRVL_08435 [Trypanosoma vivax]CCC50789.1 conserved hypothetical protein [Trypanosoma vivax Y486]
MSSVFTHGALGGNPMAQKYGRMASVASLCGSKNFVFTHCHDDRHAFPRHHHRQSDTPWKDSFSWNRIRWWIHDFRMFGLWGALKRHYYIGEPWRRKDEKIFVGKDENGNKYWLARRSQGSFHVRMVEAADPHWFRGQAPHTASPMWMKWMQGNAAHTPAQVRARGEWGHNSRLGMALPFNIKYDEYSPINNGETYTRDPMWVSAPGLLVNPERRALEEAGYSRWVINKGMPLYMPFCGVHDYPDELVEEYYRGQWAFGRASKGNDHDEWRN